MNNMFFAGAYENVKLLSDREDVKVILVRHKTLNCLRVMKILKKQEAKGKLFFEASLLESLRHPGIPVLYDFFEQDDTVFLLEEYIHGEPLNEYLLSHTLSEEEIIRFAIKLSDILIYLHTGLEFPILYQDMKPEHIFIEGDSLRLVDYGICRFLSGSAKERKEKEQPIYGTRSYASPEQLAGSPADERSDIYSLGRVVKELSEHCGGRISRQFIKILTLSLFEDPEKRPKSVKEWREMWLQLLSKKEEILKREKRFFLKLPGVKEPPNLVISVLGNEKGIGTTHIAISALSFLNRLFPGSAEFWDFSGNDTAKRIMINSRAFKKRGDMIYHRGFKSLLTDETDPEKLTKGSPFGLTVMDCGVDEKISGSSLLIYVLSGSLWRSHEIMDLNKVGNKCVIILNSGNRLLATKISRSLNKRVYLFPADSDAFYLSRKKKYLFYRIFKESGVLSV